MSETERQYIKGLVSVIIPTFNVEKYVASTINCAVNQTFKDVEIIVVDDCSSDRTVDIVKEMMKEHGNIKLFVQPRNMGAAEARNRGLTEAVGEYVAFLDSDDLWENNKIELQMEDMARHSIGFSYTTYDLVDGEGKRMKGPIKIKRKTTYKHLMTRTIISTPTVMINRTIVGDLKMPLRRTGQDYAFWLLLLRSCNAYGINQTLVHVRKRKGSLSKNKFRSIRDVWEVQTLNEGINKFSAFRHVIGYCLYTLKKRLFR